LGCIEKSAVVGSRGETLLRERGPWRQAANDQQYGSHYKRLQPLRNRKQSTQPGPCLNLAPSSHGRDEIVEMKEQKERLGSVLDGETGKRGRKMTPIKLHFAIRRVVATGASIPSD
jgi:hypothetical protein